MSIYDDLDDFRIIWRDYYNELRLTPVVFNKYVTIIIMIRNRNIDLQKHKRLLLEIIDELWPLCETEEFECCTRIKRYLKYVL
jgi:hypothetical protein